MLLQFIDISYIILYRMLMSDATDSVVHWVEVGVV